MHEVVRKYRFREFINLMSKYTSPLNYSHSQRVDKKFCPETWDEALHSAKYGMKEQYKIEKIISNMSLLEHVKTKTFGMDETGLCVDIGAYLNGEPECWIAEKFDYKPKKVVKILVNVSHSWNFTPDVIYNRGAGIVSLIQMLKKQGYIVKVNIYDGTMYNFKKYFYFLTLPSNPLDIQSLTFCLCSASLLRRFGFAFLEKETGERYCFSYGSPIALDEVVMSKDIIHFNGLNNEKSNYRSEEETKTAIKEMFNEFLRLNNEVDKNEYRAK